MRKRKEIFQECIKNYLYKTESVLKIHLYLLNFGARIAFTVRLKTNVGQFSVCAVYRNSTQNKASIVPLLYRIRVVTDISYNKCTQRNA
jgi:hypothetical protein